MANMWRRRTAYPLLLWLVLTAVIAAAWIRFGSSNLTTVLTIVSTLVALLPVLKVGPLSWSAPGRQSTPAQVDQAVQVLAIEVRKQWDEEARRRQLQEARQMPVRWEVADRPHDRLPLPPAGQLPRLIDEFVGQPRPMVVIGEPGSGKTGLCVILTLDLLKEASGRVPVLLQIAGWNPDENLDDWLVRRLVEDYPFLGNEARFGAGATREIVTQRLVLPILDGLDEMPPELRPVALRALDDDWSADRPFVLTCRTEEFLAANAQNLLVGVLVVRLRPLEPQAAANFLLDATADTRLEEWEPVLADLVAHPSDDLAQTLTNPLMLALARTVYEAEDASPRELLDRRRFPAQQDVEEHLLDRFIPTVFRSRPHRAVPSPTRVSRRWDPAVAERALTFLAGHLQTLRTRDLAWWQLARAVPRPVSRAVRVTVGTVSCGLLGWVMFGLFGRPQLGVAFGLLVGLFAAPPMGRLRDKRPRRFVPRIFRRAELAPEFLVRDIGFGVVGVLVGGLIVGLLFSVGYGVLIGLFFGLVFGMVRRFTEPTEPKEPASPSNVLRADRSTVLYGTALGGAAGAMVGGLLGGVVGAERYGLIFHLSPLAEGLLGAGVGLLLGAAGLGMMVYATSAWAQFVLARLWLAYRGLTPLRLMTFLQDAHKLGVLRQVGSQYQFRHALLQERLAQPPAAPVAAPEAETAIQG
ncbi:NACHT domain-containing protein [Micromonospora sp. NPDC048930]|uniref:NACHT domain-containing protein n=1 Tax=Micromonospora sp. NPDC048930 TaxID=3364261 RepID=UPI0037150D9D